MCFLFLRISQVDLELQQMASKKPKTVIIQTNVAPGALQVADDSQQNPRDRKKKGKRTTNTSVSVPIPSTSSTTRLISNEDEIVVKTEPIDDIKQEVDEGDMYFEIESATLQNEDLFNQALSQIEQKILIEEEARPDSDHPVRNVVLLVPDADDDIDIVIKNEPPSPNPGDCTDNDEENFDAPSTSNNLRRSLRLRKISVCTNTLSGSQNEKRKKSSSSVSHKTKRKKDGRIANEEPEELVLRSQKSAPALDDVKEEIEDDSSENVELEKVTISKEATPSNCNKNTSVKKVPKYQKHNVSKKLLQKSKLKLKRQQRLPSIPHCAKVRQVSNRKVSKKLKTACKGSRAHKASAKIVGESNKLSDESTEVNEKNARCNDSRPDTPQTQSELEETSQQDSPIICEEIPCNQVSNIVPGERLLDEMILNGRWSPSSIKAELGDELTLSSLISNDLEQAVEAQSPEHATVNIGNTVGIHNDQQCSTKLELRKIPTSSFRIFSTIKDSTVDETSSTPAEPKPTEVKRPRGRPRKHPRTDPALKVPKKIGRPKINRTEEEILEMRRQKNSRRAFKKRMKNQQLREQKQLANVSNQKTKKKKKDNEQTKKIYKYRHVWRPHPVELYQKAHRNHIVACGAEMISTKLELSVGHGTFENPHWTLEKDELRCICPGCGDTFGNVAEILLHKRKVHAEICPSCSICGKPVIRPDCMLRHKRRHLSLDELKVCYDREVGELGLPPQSRNDRLYQCSICSKILIGWATMRIHEKIHTEAYSTQCPTCFKPIYRKDYLKYHMTTHLGFDEKIQLWKERAAKKAPRVRKRNGTSTIPYGSGMRSSRITTPKPVVMKTFDLRKGDTTIHLHEVKIEVEPPEKRKPKRCRGPADCSECGKTFRTIYVLKKHTLTMHSKTSDENPFRTSCPICSRPFERSEYLSKHVQTHMNEKEKQLFSKWGGTWKQFLESLGNGNELPEPRKHRGRPKKQTEVVKVAKKRGRPRKNLAQ